MIRMRKCIVESEWINKKNKVGKRQTQEEKEREKHNKNDKQRQRKKKIERTIRIKQG